MEDVKRKFYENYLLGAIRYKSAFNFYLTPIAWWILNHYKYDPTNRGVVFRDNVLNVTDDKIGDFIKSIESDKTSVEELVSVLPTVPFEYKYFYFFVDLDRKTFVSSFPDIEVEDYLPDSSWKGIFGASIDYLPNELKRVVSQDS